MGELYNSTTNSIRWHDEKCRRRSTQLHETLNRKSSNFCLSEIHGLFEDNAGNSWNSIEKIEIEKQKCKESIRINVIAFESNEK